MAKLVLLHDNEGVRTAPRLIAWGLGLAAMAVIVGGLVLDRIAAEQHVPGSGPLWLYPFLVAAVSAPAVLGALIVAWQPHNRIGWILVVGALSLAAVLAATPYVWVALYAHPGSLPGGSWAALVSRCGRRSSLGRWPWRSCSRTAGFLRHGGGRTRSSACSVTSLVLLLVIADQLEDVFGGAEPVSAPALRLSPSRLPVWLAMFASLFVGAAAARTRSSAPRG